MPSGLVHFSGRQFAADPNPNRACDHYKHYTGVRTLAMPSSDCTV